MKQDRKLRLLALLTAAALGFGSLPGIALAEEEETIPEPTAVIAPEEEPAMPSEAPEGLSDADTEPVIPEEEAPPDPEPVESVTITPEDAEITVTGEAVPVLLSCGTEDADIYFAVSADGETYTEFALYEGTVPELTLESGFGTWYIKAYAEKEGFLPSEPTVRCFTERRTSGWGFYFGQLHAHCDLSDGLGTAEEAFAYAAQVENLDFFALTDHSNSLDGDTEAAIGEDASAVSQDWARGKAAALAVTSDRFVGIYGYEMTWQEGKHLGHLNTFNTPGFQSRNQSAYASQPTALQNYYDTLTTLPGSVSQFNHPGTLFGDFCDFAYYTEERDAAITLLEVGSGKDAYEYYTRALDKGWHVAPTNNQNNHRGSWGDADEGRTVVYAAELTESAIYDAMRRYRVYATEDSDLTIHYTLGGNFMGSRVEQKKLGAAAEIQVRLSDPTDGSAGRAAVIVDGGIVLAEADTKNGLAVFDVPTDYRYYYIRVTQPDGDTAVTAPVWIETTESAGIGSFSCDTTVPVQGESVTLTLELYHQGRAEFTVEEVVFSINGEILGTLTEDAMTHRFSYTHTGLGHTDIQVSVTACLNGEKQSYEETLTLNYRRPDMVKTILVDGQAGEFTQLAALAEEHQIAVTASQGSITGEMLDGASILIVTAPEAPFPEEYLALVTEFTATGGTLVVCGQSAALDGAVSSSEELNRLLEAAGATLRLRADTAQDPENNGGSAAELYLTDIRAADICAGVTEDQVFRVGGGCTVDPGQGATLASAGGAAILAWEEAGLGKVYAAGSLFLGNTELAEPKNIWAAPYANRTIAQNLLRVNRAELALNDIHSVRTGEPGEVYRVRGYVTAGTSDPYNAFPNTLYIQDDTGGIAVIPFDAAGIEVGTPMELQGYLDQQDGNPVLELISWEVLDALMREYTPKTIPNASAMDYSLHGGELVQIEGEAAEITRTGETGISRLVLEDENGDSATVLIEDFIFSGATGKNTLAKTIRTGRQVRAIGLVHISDDGEVVLRVRNCDEVVYVPPVPESPDTGDLFPLWPLTALPASAAGLLLLRKKKR